jgi:hypothetical protein
MAKLTKKPKAAQGSAGSAPRKRITLKPGPTPFDVNSSPWAAAAGMTPPKRSPAPRKVLVVRTRQGVLIDGKPAGSLLNKHPAVRVQPAPAAPRHLTSEQISQMATLMKLA